MSGRIQELCCNEKRCLTFFQRRRFDYNELVGIAGNESRVLTVDSIFELDSPEFLGQLMDLICAGNMLFQFRLSEIPCLNYLICLILLKTLLFTPNTSDSRQSV